MGCGQSAEAKAKQEKEEEFQKCITNLTSTEFHERQKALQVLGEKFLVESAPKADEIAPLMDDQHVLVRIAAINCIGKIGLPAAKNQATCEKVASKIREKEDAVKKAAIATLGMMGENGSNEAIKMVAASETDAAIRKNGAKILAEQGAATKAHVDELVRCLQDKVDDVRNSCAEALGKIMAVDSSVSDKVMPLLKDEAWRQRRAATMALGFMGPAGEKYMANIAEMLKDEHKDVKSAAMDALGNIGAPAAVHAEEIAAFQDDKVDTVKASAKACLPKIGKGDLVKS